MSGGAGIADPLERFTDGDRAAARQLRTSLTILRDQAAGLPLAARIDEVLTGRSDIGTLAADPALATTVHDAMRRFAEDWAAMSPEQRADLVSRGEAYGAALDQEDRQPPRA